jgi:hypothetical protein
LDVAAGRITHCKIHPAIGVARVGDSPDEFFIGPETNDRPLDSSVAYKDPDGRIKRQAARFRIYGYDKNDVVVCELTSEKAKIRWKVHLANKKASWFRFETALDVPEAKAATRRNDSVEDRSELIIDGGEASISAGEAPVKLGGFFRQTPVDLGELRVEPDGRLIVLGGHGHSGGVPANTPLTTFANNDGWYDDTSDGPVSATVEIGGRPLPVDEAWLLVAPPDYAPGIPGLVTAYDVIEDVGSLPRLGEVEFWRHVFPILSRLSRMQWVNYGFFVEFGWESPWNFLDPDTLAQLAQPDENAAELRRQIFNRFRHPELSETEPQAWPPIYGDEMDVPRPRNNPRHWLALTRLQYERLRMWAHGEFRTGTRVDAPESFNDIPLAEQPATLDRAALEACLGGPFHPGCEVTWPIRHSCMYRAPFRIRRRPPGTVEPQWGTRLTIDMAIDPVAGPLVYSGPGDLTRWMAVPWQADTASCLSGYEPLYDPYLPTFWPSRVPNHVVSEATYRQMVDERVPAEERRRIFRSARQNWLRQLPTKSIPRITKMVASWSELGIVRSMPGLSPLPDQLFVEAETIIAPEPQSVVDHRKSASPGEPPRRVNSRQDSKRTSPPSEDA